MKRALIPLAVFALLDAGYAEVYMVERPYLSRESAPIPPPAEGEPPRKRWSMFDLYPGAVLGLKGPADDPKKVDHVEYLATLSFVLPHAPE